MKYEFVEDDTIELALNIPGVPKECRTLTRIRLLEDLYISPRKTIPKGTLGGYLEFEYNLSQEGICWVDQDSMVFGDIEIHGKSFLNKSWVTGLNAKIKDTAFIDVKLLDPDTKLVSKGCYINHGDNKVMLIHDGRHYILE